MHPHKVSALLLVMALSSLAPAPAPAAQGPGLTPTTYSHVMRSVAAGDEYEISCDGATSDQNGSYVVFFALVDSWGGTSGQGQAQFGVTHPVVVITAADGHVASVPLPEGGGSDLPSIAWSGTARYAGKLRVVWAGWTTPISCAVSVNGIPSTPASLDPSKAVQARVRDFTGTASVDSELAGAGTGVKFERNVDGFVYSWLWAEGATSNTGPDNQSAQSPRFFWVGQSTGKWTHSVNWGYNVFSIRGFILETPK